MKRLCNELCNVLFIPGVTILLSLTVFLLLVAETMPPTSDAVPLIGEGCPIKLRYLVVMHYTSSP